MAVVLNTTPTIQVKQNIAAAYESVILTFRKYDGTKVVKENPTNIEGVFHVPFSQDDLSKLGVGTHTFEIQYFYNNSKQTNIEVEGKFVVVPSFSSGKVAGEGGIYDENIYTAKIVTETVVVNGGGSGENGATFTPIVTNPTPDTLQLAWKNDKGLPNPTTVVITAPKGDKGDAFTYEDFTPEQIESLKVKGDAGDDGATFVPTVTDNKDGTFTLSWSNTEGHINPYPITIQLPKGQDGEDGNDGADATINGVNALTVAEGENISISMVGNTLTISAVGGGTEITVEQGRGQSVANVMSQKAVTDELIAVNAVANSAIKVETDPTVPSWAKANTKPTYTAEEVGALPDSTMIPTNNDQLENGREFITNLVENLVNYYKKSETMTREQILEQIANVGNWQTAFVDELPATGVINTIYFVPSENPTVQDEKDEFMWNAIANKFERIGATAISLDGLVTTEQLNTALSDYYTKAQADTRYEPKRTTNGTAYNKNFGSGAGTVVEGNRVLTDVPSGAVFTDTVYDDTAIRQELTEKTSAIETDITTNYDTATVVDEKITEAVEVKEDISTPVTLTSAQVASGVALGENVDIAVTGEVNNFVITSAGEYGAIQFVAGSAVAFTFPANNGWSGEAPEFTQGLLYTIVYYKGSFVSVGGR